MEKAPRDIGTNSTSSSALSLWDEHWIGSPVSLKFIRRKKYITRFTVAFRVLDLLEFQSKPSVVDKEFCFSGVSISFV